MRPKVTTSSFAAATIALAAITVATGTAPAAGRSRWEGTAGQTLHLVESGGGLEIVDNPPSASHAYDFSAGDIVIVTRRVSRAGRRAGTLRLTCTATTPRTQHCDGTIALAGGTLEVAGESSAAPTTVVAVVGGTGVYHGAHGTSVAKDRAGRSDTADMTITLDA